MEHDRRLRVAICDQDDIGPLAGDPAIEFVAVDRPADEPLAGRHHLIVGRSDAAANPWVDVTVGSNREAAELVDERLVPWVTRWRQGRRAPRAQTAKLSEPDDGWAPSAARLVARLRVATDGLPVRRIDHIGSTSVPQLPAKNLIDIQILVPADPDGEISRSVAKAAVSAGFVWVSGDWFGKDRSGGRHLEQVCVDADPGRPVNINIRSDDAPVGRDALLFRDWLRAIPEARARYLALKTKLAGGAIDDYGDGKEPFISAALDEAEGWAQSTGWTH